MCSKAAIDIIQEDVPDGSSGDKLITVRAVPGATSDFVKDLVFKESLFPKDILNLTILVCGKETRKYGSRRPVVVYKFVLMDSNQSMIYACTNSGVSKLLKGKLIQTGSLLSIRDYSLLWMMSDSRYERKVSLLINDFGWQLPDKSPSVPREWDFFDAEADRSKEYLVSAIAVKHVYETQFVSYLVPKRLDSTPFINQVIWRGGDAKYVHENAFYLRDKKQREAFLRDQKKRPHSSVTDDTDDSDDSEDESNKENRKERNNGICDCVRRFNLADCSLEIAPLGRINYDTLFEEMQGRFRGNVVADDFFELFPKHQRWCCYHYYFVNVLHGPGIPRRVGERVELPKCLVDGIRLAFPEPSGNYVGFRSNNTVTI